MPAEGANVGHYMIGIGAIIELKGTNKILVLKRNSDFQHGQWEIMYGRIDQHEEFAQGLKREVREETGIIDLKIKSLSRIWHIYRGEKLAENELFGCTFICETETEYVKLSREHTEYKWVNYQEAVGLSSVSGIDADMKLYARRKNGEKIGIEYSNLDETTVEY